MRGVGDGLNQLEARVELEVVNFCKGAGCNHNAVVYVAAKECQGMFINVQHS